MRQLFPAAHDRFDTTDLLDRKDRQAPPGRPWVMANMVMSVDGAYSVAGRSAPLSSPHDRDVFHTLRAAADAILVGAGTARTERYGRPATRPDLSAARRAAGAAGAPRLVVVSRSLRIPDDQPFLGGDGPEPLVLHPEGADTTGQPIGMELRAVGDGAEVDLAAALEGLRRDGVEQVLCEGGPHLLGRLHHEQLLDELFVSVAPMLVGGERTGLLGQVEEHAAELRLHRVVEGDGTLFLTYRCTT